MRAVGTMRMMLALCLALGVTMLTLVMRNQTKVRIPVLTLFMLMSSTGFAQENRASPFLTADEAVANMTEAQAMEAAAYSLGVQTVLWGNQYVKAGAALRSMAAPLPEGSTKSPVDPYPHAYNVFGHARAALTHEIRLVEQPNSETPYSAAVIDLSNGPVVVVHPDMGGRYFRTTVWDAFGQTRTISQKKDGDQPKPYLLAREGWNGKVPEGLGLIKFRSRLALLAPHIALTTAANDMEKVNALQDGHKLIALKDWGKSNKALSALSKENQIRPLIPPNTKTPMALMFFEMLGQTLKDLDLYEDEKGFYRQLTRIGITDDGFDYESLDDASIRGLERAVADAHSIMEYKMRNISQVQDGGTWMVGTDITSHDDWLFRACAGYKWVWGDLYSEIIYPMVWTDEKGDDLSGQSEYTIHFEKGHHPDARYWQITMYDLDGFLVANPIKRYGIGNMNTDLDVNEDGSITIFVQRESPEKELANNWLPSPEGGYLLMMRMYQPGEKMYSGKYIVPPVVKR